MYVMRRAETRMQKTARQNYLLRSPPLPNPRGLSATCQLESRLQIKYKQMINSMKTDSSTQDSIQYQATSGVAAAKLLISINKFIYYLKYL
jgi:hypothetical protein